MKQLAIVLVFAGVVALSVWLSATLWHGAQVDSIESVRLNVAQGESEGNAMTATTKVHKSRYQLAPEIQSQTWLNGAPTALAELRGRVVLIDFWTFG